MGTQLAERRVEISAYEQFTERERALIHRTVAKNTSPEELLMFLNVCAMHNLNPMPGVREMWCVKMPGKNGSEGDLVMIVGKYGWLKVVERRADYRGTTSGIVHENDTFKKLARPVKMPTGQYTFVQHEFDVTVDRGRMLGAYAEVYREGRPTEFTYVKLEQYQPFATERKWPDQVEADFHGITVFLSKGDYFKPWWNQTDSMIDKCARTTGWRNAFPIGALYGEEELASGMAERIAETAGTQTEQAIEWGEDPAVASRMQSLFAAANNVKPGAYSTAKILLLLGGLSDEERLVLAETEIGPFIEANGGIVPEDGVEVVDIESMTIEEPEGYDPTIEM